MASIGYNGMINCYTYMAWQMITDRSSKQYKLKQDAGQNFNSEGFGIINNRYVIATTETFGKIGDYLNFKTEKGDTLYCVIGDFKSSGDSNWRKYGHYYSPNSLSVVEFIVDQNTWYSYGKGSHVNPGTSGCHNEWKGQLQSWENVGNFWTGGPSGSSSNKLEEFIAEAEKHIGESFYSWTQKVLGISGYEAWCSDFVRACAKTVGIEGTVISGSPSAYMCMKNTIEKCGGISYLGSSNYQPQRGDLVTFMWNGADKTWNMNSNYVDHIGIVTKFSGNTVYTIEGNTSRIVAKRQYSRNSSSLVWFVHPNWEKVNGYENLTSGNYGVIGNLYQTSNTRKDAILREICYLNGNKLSLSKTSVKLASINYTDLFSAFWDVGKVRLSGSSITSGNYDLSQLDSKVRACIEYLNSKGLNAAAACGICGNIKAESNFDTSSDHWDVDGLSAGICQWHLGRRTSMINYVGEGWQNNLSGQLDFLYHELEQSYSSLLNTLKNVPDTESGAKTAADAFVKDFERPAHVETQSLIRQKNAADYFSKLTIITAQNNLSTSFSSLNLNGVSNKRQIIVEAAYSTLGTPYVWGGEEPGRGLDCSGVVKYCYSKIGINLPHQSASQRDHADHRYPVGQALPGDALWIPGHVGIYVGENKVVEEYHGGSYSTWSNPGGPCEETALSRCNWVYALRWDAVDR